MWYEKILEKNLIPDGLIRWAIRKQLAERLEKVKRQGESGQQQFIQELRESPIAICTKAANDQHYEVPPGFFHYVLGRHLKYSCGYWPEGCTDMDDSEAKMLDLYIERAEIVDGQDILDLGCGWGSLSLYLAQKFPNAQITGVSNSALQRLDIQERATKLKLNNVTILTADMNEFKIDKQFDRIVSIEMFEHMRGYEKLFNNISGWLKEDGKLFVHIFCHKDLAYPFMADDKGSWMAKYFFSGGIMPSENLFKSFNEKMEVKDRWVVDGKHYQKTCEAWLKRMDKNRAEIFPIFKRSYGPDEALKWWVYWRIFFMACAELFGYEDGKEWYVGHYLMERTRSAVGADPRVGPEAHV